MTVRGTTCMTAAVSLAFILAGVPPASAQLEQPEVPGLRGAPFAAVHPGPDVRSFGEGPEWDARPPPGIEPLAVDLFTSTAFGPGAIPEPGTVDPGRR